MQTKRLINTLRPRLVTFDITGTLLKPAVEEHYMKAGAKHGVPVTNPQMLAPSFKKHFSRLCHEHPVFGKHSGLGWRNWWKTVISDVFRDQNSGIPQDIIDKIATDLMEDFGTEKCWEKIPGAVDLLEYLNHRGVVVGVISNFDERLESILTSTGIRDHFAFVITSYSHGREKPHASIFERALDLFENKYQDQILPQEALHIGDNLKLDYIGARNAGWSAFLIVRDSKSRKEVPADQAFESLDELAIHLRKYLH